MGERQKGRSDLKLASLRRDREWVERAREAAFAIVDGEGGDGGGLERPPRPARRGRPVPRRGGPGVPAQGLTGPALLGVHAARPGGRGGVTLREVRGPRLEGGAGGGRRPSMPHSSAMTRRTRHPLASLAAERGERAGVGVFEARSSKPSSASTSSVPVVGDLLGRVHRPRMRSTASWKSVARGVVDLAGSRATRPRRRSRRRRRAVVVVVTAGAARPTSSAGPRRGRDRRRRGGSAGVCMDVAPLAGRCRPTGPDHGRGAGHRGDPRPASPGRRGCQPVSSSSGTTRSQRSRQSSQR